MAKAAKKPNDGSHAEGEGVVSEPKTFRQSLEETTHGLRAMVAAFEEGQTALRETEQELAIAREESRSFAQKLEKAEIRLNRAATEHQTLTGELEQRNARIAELEQARGEAESLLEHVRGEQERTEAELQEARNAGADWERRHGEVQQRVGELEEELAASAARLTEVAANQQQILDELDDTEARADQLEALIQEREATIRELEAAKAQLAQGKDKLAADVAALEQQVAELRTQIEETSTARDAVAAELEAARTRAESDLQALEAARARIGELDLECDELEQRESAAIEAQVQLQKEIQRFREAAEEAALALEGTRVELVDLRSETEDQRSMIESLRNDLGARTARLSELDGSLVERDKLLTKRERQLKELAAERDTLRHELQGLRNERTNLAAALDGAASAEQLAEMQAIIDEGENEVERLRAQLAELRSGSEAAAEALRAEVEALQGELADSRSGNEASGEALRAELEELRASHAHIRSEWEQDCAAWEIDHNALQEALRENEALRAERDSALDAQERSAAALDDGEELEELRAVAAERENKINALKQRLADERQQAQTEIETLRAELSELRAGRAAPRTDHGHGGRPATNGRHVEHRTPDHGMHAVSAEASRGGGRGARLTGSSAFDIMRERNPEAALRLESIMDERPDFGSYDRMGRLDVSTKAAYLLSRMDGSVTVADLIDTAGLPPEETAAILLDLVEQAII